MTEPFDERTDPLLLETVERLLADVSTQDEVEHAESDGGWSRRTWEALAEGGFPWVGIPEAQGGSGGRLLDAAALASAIGRHSAAVPQTETSMIGGWLLGEAGLELPEGPVTALAEPAEVVEGRIRVEGVAAWGRHAARLVVAGCDGLVASLRPDDVTVVPESNVAGEARDHVTVDVALDAVESAQLVDAHRRLLLRGALSRAALTAGALQAVSQMTVDYTSERHQFGRPVARFQAVQHHLIVTAQSAVRAQMAAHVAARSLSGDHPGIDVAVARVVCDDAIVLGTRAAHQAHGAMGVTREYPLHHLTRRLWSWRHEWGTARRWRRELGEAVVDAGPERLFELISG